MFGNHETTYSLDGLRLSSIDGVIFMTLADGEAEISYTISGRGCDREIEWDVTAIWFDGEKDRTDAWLADYRAGVASSRTETVKIALPQTDAFHKIIVAAMRDQWNSDIIDKCGEEHDEDEEAARADYEFDRRRDDARENASADKYDAMRDDARDVMFAED